MLGLRCKHCAHKLSDEEKESGKYCIVCIRVFKCGCGFDKNADDLIKQVKSGLDARGIVYEMMSEGGGINGTTTPWAAKKVKVDAVFLIRLLDGTV